MAMPKQIQEQSEAIKAMYDGASQDEDGGPVTDNPATEPVVADSEPAFAPALDSDEQLNSNDQDEETFEQKYRTLQGMYNAEVPQLNHDNQQLNARVGQLEQLLSSVSPADTGNTQPAADSQFDQFKAPDTKTPAALITEQDVEDYGESIDIMRKAAREEARADQQRIAALEARLQELQTNVVPQMEAISQRQVQTSEQTFWSGLTEAVPKWQEINDNQDFQTWLLSVDPLTGSTRQSFLEAAQQNLDAPRVAKFFQTWLGDDGDPSAHSGRTAATSELERQIAPGRGRGRSAPSDAQGKTYSTEDITSFYEDVRKGNFAGREDERGRIERDIFAAQRDGRITHA